MSNLNSYQTRQQIRQQAKQLLSLLPTTAQPARQQVLQAALGQELNLRLQQNETKMERYAQKINKDAETVAPTRADLKAAKKWLWQTYQAEINSPAKLWVWVKLWRALLGYELQLYLNKKNRASW